MGVDTHGLEAIRNSAENVAGDKPGNTFIKSLNGWLFQRIGRVFEKISVNSTQDDFSFLQDSIQHYRIRVTYANSSKKDVIKGERIV